MKEFDHIINEEIQRIKILSGIFNDDKLVNEQWKTLGKFTDDVIRAAKKTGKYIPLDRVNITKPLDVLNFFINNKSLWKTINKNYDTNAIQKIINDVIQGKRSPFDNVGGNPVYRYIPTEGNLRYNVIEAWRIKNNISDTNLSDYLKKVSKNSSEDLKHLPKPKTTPKPSIEDIDPVDAPVGTTWKGTLTIYEDGKPKILTGDKFVKNDDGTISKFDKFGKETDRIELNKSGEYVSDSADDVSMTSADETEKIKKSSLTDSKVSEFFSEHLSPIFEVWQLRFKEILMARKSKEDIIKMWEDGFNEAIDKYSTNVTQGDYSIKILRDKFLQLGKTQEKMLWSEILSDAEKKAYDAYPNKKESVKLIFDKLKATGAEDGLDFIFSNIGTKGTKSSSNYKSKINEWLNEFKTPPKVTGWAENTKNFIIKLLKKFGRAFISGTTLSPMEYRVLMARKGYKTKGAIQLEFRRLFTKKVLLPTCAGLSWFLLYGGGEPFGGFRRIFTALGTGDFTNSPEEIAFFDEYIWPLISKSSSMASIIEHAGLDKGWLWYVADIAPGDLDLLALSFSEGLKSQEEETGRWKFKDKNGNLVTDKNGEVLVFSNLKDAADYSAENKKYTCASDISECARLKTELIRRKTQTYEKLKVDAEKFRQKAKEKLEQASKDPESTAKVARFTTEILKNGQELYGLTPEQVSLITSNTIFRGDQLYYIDNKANEYPITIIPNIDPITYEFYKWNKQDQNGNLMRIKDIFLTNESTMKGLKMILEEKDGKKFGDDNFKHWKDTFQFQSADEKNPGQYKDVTIKMEDVMDRIDHYRKKYDEDDAFVRAVVDTHEDVVRIMFTKDLAHIHEGTQLKGLALVLMESRGEKEVWSVARPASGNWFLVKGDFNQKQLANMNLQKKEPRDKNVEKKDSPLNSLKKKEETIINSLKSNEKEDIESLPTKVKQKLKEKLSNGWTTETPIKIFNHYYDKSDVNSVFNGKIGIFKLKPSSEFFNDLERNSARINIKRGFCKSLVNVKKGSELTGSQERVVTHFINKCKTKYDNKFGVPQRDLN
jgi:hypothetical protein